MGLKFRRGTTAQQSGSLAFGEPYVNTTLGTLVIGGQSGDIVLSSGGTGSTGNFGAISGSGLDITGNANIAGNLTLGGAITIGDASVDTVNVVASLSSSLIPQTTNAFDLGSATKIWRDLYISTGSIKFVEGTSVVKTLTAATLTALEAATGSSNIAVNALNSFTSSQLTQNTALATISGSLISSASANTIAVANLNTTTASLNTSVSNLNSFSSSQLTQNTALATISGSLIGSASAAKTTNDSQDVSVSNLNTFSGSANTRFTEIGVVSGSLIASASAAKTTNDSQGVSITNLNSATASLLIETANLETFSSSALTRLDNLEGKDISITLTGDVTGAGTITNLANVSFATTIAANSVALGTDTTGDYVASMTAGSGITVGTATGEGSTPVITNTGVTSNVAGTGISVSGATGAVTITNSGVTSAVAGTGVGVSGATGAVTFSIGQAVATSSNVQFNSLGIGMAASATAGRIDATNDVVAFSSSDIRFKENIVPIENALDKISKISGNTYDWKAENKVEHGYEGNDVGVIAQEIEAVLPQLVQTRENGFKAVKYDKLVALLIEGIKEQQSQIEKLRMDLDNYECKCDNCKSE